jgi:hypothetical protein
MRIYSIVYDRNDLTIKPLIYVEDLSSNGSYWNGAYMGKGNGSCLLSDGDELRLSPRLSVTFRSNTFDKTEKLTDLQEKESMVSVNPVLSIMVHSPQQSFEHDFRISDRMLGSGAHGKVYMAIDVMQGCQVACKVVDLKKIREIEQGKMEHLKSTRGRLGERRSASSNLRVWSHDKMIRCVEETVSKVARECEILKSISHVRCSSCFAHVKLY